LIAQFSSEIKNVIKEKIVNIQLLVKRLKSLNPDKVNINSLFVSVSDGEKSVNDAIKSSLLVSLPNGVDPLAFIETPTPVIENNAPIAKAGADQNITQGESVTLDGSQSSDRDGEINSYIWKEGEKVLGRTALLKISNFSVGVHTITLTVKDDKGAIGSDTIICIINKKKLILTFKVKKTGQKNSYDVDGNEVTDKSLKDDGFYQIGVDVNYTRDADKETVTDHLTDLIWQDDSAVASVKKPWIIQENWNAGDYNNTTGDTATTYCRELVLSGYEDWRLPTIVELQNIVNSGAYEPTLDATFINFANRDSSYWSSTTPNYLSGNVWMVSFSYGTSNRDYKFYNYYVRCVRGKK